MNTTPKLHLTLESDHAVLERVVDETEAYVRQLTQDEDLIYKIMLLTTEAVTNAIEHGNQMDTAKQVRLDIFPEGQEILVHVEDEGEGFEPDAVRDPLADENLFRDGGRGLFLIDQMADAYEIEDHGRRLIMRFRNPPAP